MTTPAQCAADPLVYFRMMRERRKQTAAPFQIEREKAFATCLHAVCRGEKPPYVGAFLEGSKGTDKSSFVADSLCYVAQFAQVPVAVDIGADDKEQAALTFRAIEDNLDIGPEWQKSRLTTGRNRIDGPKTIVEILSSDASSAHGRRPTIVFIDELSHISRFTFAETLADNSTKVQNSFTIIASNAGFVGSDAWRWRELARTSPEWFFHRVDQPPPWISQTKIDEAKARNTTERFLRLWYSVWSRGLGDALDGADILGAINDEAASNIEPPVGFAAGLDLGIKHDHSALVVVGKRGYESPLYSVPSVRTWAPIAGKVNLEEVEQAVRDAHRRYNLQSVCYDVWQAELMAERLRKDGIRMVPISFSGQSQDVMARCLLEVFRSKTVAIPNHPRLLSDLGRLSIVEARTGNYKLVATRDHDGHADSATALVLGLLAARNHCDSFGGNCTVDFDVRLGTAQFVNRREFRESEENHDPSSPAFGQGNFWL